MVMRSVNWSDYTTEELEEIIKEDSPVVIVPIGATEQHGPHLAINTDADIGYQIVKRVAETSPVKTLILPSVWTGVSPHHMNFCGTISIKQSTLFALTYDILESLIHHGVKRLLVVNSHGGNMALLKTVTDEIGMNTGISPVYVTYWQLIADVIDDIRESKKGGMSHACELETSLKLLLSPQDVREDRFKDVMIEGDEFHSVDMFGGSKIGIYKPFKVYSPTGQIGAPSKASKEKGQQILDALINKFHLLIKSKWLGGVGVED